MQLLRESMADGFDGVHRRQDVTNGRITAAEARVNELSERLVVVEGSKTTMATVGGAVATIAGAIGAIVGYFSK